MNQDSQSQGPFRDAATGRIYRVTIEYGYYWQIFADGSRKQGGPASSAAGGPVPNSAYGNSGVQSAAYNISAPRSVPQGSSHGYSNPVSTSPPGPSAYTYWQDPNSTPTPASYLAQGLGQLSLNDQRPARWQNPQIGTDQFGTSYRSVDGPAAVITDPVLFQNNIVASKYLMGTEGEAEVLDEDFRKRDKPSKFFRIGKVFLVLWSEPSGNVNQSNSTDVTRVRFNENVHTKIRRFVVVREGHNSCSAVPISTYNNRGVAAPAVMKSEHAVIHTGRDAPRLMSAERKLHQRELPIREGAVRVDPFDKTDKLDPASRINLGKVYTVEHSLKVKGFGMVVDVPALERHFWEVWAGQSPLKSRDRRSSLLPQDSGQTRKARERNTGSSGASRPSQRQIEDRSRDLQDRQRAYRNERRNEKQTEDADGSDDDNEEDDRDENEDEDEEESENEEDEEDEEEDDDGDENEDEEEDGDEEEEEDTGRG